MEKENDFEDWEFISIDFKTQQENGKRTRKYSYGSRRRDSDSSNSTINNDDDENYGDGNGTFFDIIAEERRCLSSECDFERSLESVWRGNQLIVKKVSENDDYFDICFEENHILNTLINSKNNCKFIEKYFIPIMAFIPINKIFKTYSCG